MSILEESERVTENYGSMEMSQTSSFIQKGSSTESSCSRSGLDFQVSENGGSGVRTAAQNTHTYIRHMGVRARA